MDQKLWMVMAVLSGAMLLLSFRRRMQRPAAALPPQTSTAGEEVQQSLDEIFLRLQEYSRDTLARLDSKIRLLNQMLGEADQKEQSLRALLDRLPASPGSAPVAGPPLSPAVPPLRAAIPAPAPPAEAPEVPPSSPVDVRRLQVFSLADSGRTIREISMETGIQTGEVEMMLGLRRTPS